MKVKWGLARNLLCATLMASLLMTTDYVNKMKLKHVRTSRGPHRRIKPVSQSTISAIAHHPLEPLALPLVPASGGRDAGQPGDDDDDDSRRLPPGGASGPAARSFITLSAMGELGNNMFQYAGILGLAQMNNKVPCVAADFFLTAIFQLRHLVREHPLVHWKVVEDHHFAKYNATLEHLPEGHILLLSYLQSYRYFQFIAADVKKEFRFLNNTVSNAEAILGSMKHIIGNRIPIGVHVRRGHMLWRQGSEYGDRIPGTNYFQKAFEVMRRKHGSVVFLVATDDTFWCDKHLLNDKDVYLLPGACAEVHLCILTKCKHVIMSVGTFGWWGGWLAGGDVVYYNRPLLPGSYRDKQFNSSEYFLPYWIGIGD